MATKPEVAKIMGVMAMAWPRYELKAESITVYSKILADVSPEILELAAKHLMATCTFFPSINEWRRASFDIMINKPSIPSAFEAWAEVLREIEKTGSYRIPTFSHEIIQRSVECLGGWKYICLTENLEYDRAHFFKIYESLESRAEDDLRMLPDVKAEMGNHALDTGNPIRQLAAKLTR